MSNDDYIDVEVLKESIQPNSKKSKKESEEPQEEAKKLTKIVTGQVKVKKRGFGKKIADTFLEDDSKTVGHYILVDVIIPAIKGMIYEAFTGGLEMSLFGNQRTPTRGRGSPLAGSYTSYGNYYNERGPIRHDNRDVPRGVRSRHAFEQVEISNPRDAKNILQTLVDRILDYGFATVADFYDLVGEEPAFTDHNYGWTDLRGASVDRLPRGRGYILNLPRPHVID